MHDLIPFPTEYNALPAAVATMAGSASALATSNELESLLVALITIAVRELVWWWKNRRRRPTPEPPDTGGMG